MVVLAIRRCASSRLAPGQDDVIERMLKSPDAGAGLEPGMLDTNRRHESARP